MTLEYTGVLKGWSRGSVICDSTCPRLSAVVCCRRRGPDSIFILLFFGKGLFATLLAELVQKTRYCCFCNIAETPSGRLRLVYSTWYRVTLSIQQGRIEHMSCAAEHGKCSRTTRVRNQLFGSMPFDNNIMIAPQCTCMYTCTMYASRR
jgi:hypothetical protein